jgi:adenylate cyclase class IV
VVHDPAGVRRRLLAAGARAGFAGMMVDRRYDRGGELVGRDEVLRLRIFRHADGREDTVLGWKGATGISPEGYKARRELEYQIHGQSGRPEELLTALGYAPVHTIERFVEYFHLGDTAVRLEWYPRMDVLVEVEGDETGIEAALGVVGIPREEYTADALAAFTERYARRTGRPAVLVAAELDGEVPSWERR